MKSAASLHGYKRLADGALGADSAKKN